MGAFRLQGEERLLCSDSILYEPNRIRRKAEAEGQAAIASARSEAEVAALRTKSEEDSRLLHARAVERNRKKEERRQKNIEEITRKALTAMPESVDENKPEEDWVHQFFNYCEDIGDDQMQVLWSKLLAGEVAKPNSFSLRTLSTVRMLRREDADLFTKFCCFVWKDDPG